LKLSSYKGSIQNRLLKLLLLIISIIFFTGYSIFVIWYMKDKEDKNINLSQTITQVLSQDLAKLILLNDVAAASDITSKLKSFSNINSVVIYKKDKSIIYQYSKDNKTFKPEALPTNKEIKFTKNSLIAYITAKYQGAELGYIRIDTKFESLVDILKDDSFMILIFYLFIVFLSYILTSYYAKKFTRPIVKLVDFLEDIELTSSLDKKISITEDNEFGKLYEEVNTMLNKIFISQKDQKIAAVAFETQSAMIITNEKKEIIRVNKAFNEITQYTIEEVIDKEPFMIELDTTNDINEKLQDSSYWSGEAYIRDKNKKLKSIFLTIQVVLDNENPKYYICSFLDLSKQKKVEAKLKQLQQFDPLTGLANKNLFLEALQGKIDTNKNKSYHSLLCLDIKDFKILNDVYGHNTGDLILKEFSQRIKKEFSESDFISKIGIDEFILCYRNISQEKDEALLQTEILLDKLKIISSTPFKIDDKTINIILRIGVNLYDEKLHDANIILKQADSALQLAKREDKEFIFFDTEIEEESQRYLSLYNELIIAIKEQQFELYYQLQNRDDASIYGAEALVRWNHPQRGLVPPFEFIGIAENSGLIIDIGRWVLEEGCRQLAIWQQNQKTKDWVLAINVSAKQFKQDEFVSQVLSIVAKNNIPYHNLKLELTESLLANDIEIIVEKMANLRKLGIQISIDDFGTGYSSLLYLKTLPVDQIKIDQGFIFGMLENKADMAIVKTILRLGEALDFEVIAEGVETKEHFEMLKKLHCHFFQGYYFAKPQKISYIEEKYL